MLEDVNHKNSRHIKALEQNKYNFINCNNKTQQGYISLWECVRNIFLLAPIGFFLSLYLFLFRSSNFEFFYKSWLSYFKWDNFVKFNSGNNYIVYHNYQEDHILRNIFLKKNNFNLIHYKHTSSENIFNYNLKNKYNNAYQAFVFYDQEFHQTQQSIEMSEQNKSLTPIKLICGPTLFKKNINTFIKKKQIALFNSTFTDGHAANSVPAHLNFLKFIKEVLDTTDYRVIFKSKNRVHIYEDYNPIFKGILQSFKNNKDVEIIDHSLDLQEIVMTSEISIHMPFASSSVVALNHKQKFFFYDSLNYFNGSYYSKFNDVKLYSKNIKDNFQFIDFYSKMNQANYEKYISACYKKTFGNNYDNKNNIIKKYL